MSDRVDTRDATGEGAGRPALQFEPPRILPPHWFVAAIGAIALTGVLPGPALLASPWRWAGVIPIVAGVALAIAASRQFTAAGTNIVPLTRSTALVTDGAFRLSRNPMYTGMVLALLGLALVTDSLFALLVAGVFTLVIRNRFVRREEVLMAQTFGADYDRYRQRVRRWL